MSDKSMSGKYENKTVLITCGALAKEVLFLVESNQWTNMHVECLPAQLHSTPQFIPERVREKITECRSRFDRIVVLYSDCGTGGLLQKVLDEEQVESIGGAHCYEMFMTRDAYQDHMDDDMRVFYLTDFLARQFEAFVIKPLGLDRYPQLKETYFKHYEKLVLLTQFGGEDVIAAGQEASEYLGLPLEIRPTEFGDYQTYLAAIDAEQSN